MAAEGRLLFHIAEFERKLDQATKKSAEASAKVRTESRGMGAALSDGFKAMVPAVSFAALGAGIKSALQRADDLADLKVALGETAETLQRVDYAAQQAASVGVDKLADSMLKLEKNLGDIDNKNAADALGNLGVTASQLAAMPLDQKILTLSEAFQRARADGTGVKDILDLLGRSGTGLIPLLTQSKEAIEGMFADAPVVADELIDRMAILNDQFDGLVIKAKTSGVGVVGALSEVGTFLADLVAEGSLEKALLNFDDRQIDALKSIASQSEAKRVQADSMEAARAAKEEADAREKSADAAKKAAESIEKMKDSIERSEFDLLPDEAKIAALKAKLEEMLKSTVGLFSLKYDTSIEGLEALAKQREAMGDKLPSEGQNSAAEAFEWLREAKELARDRAALEKTLSEKEKAAAEAKAKEIDTLREKAEAGAFELMDPEEQARQLTQQLGKSFGFDITGVEDVERGLAEARQQVREARESGDTDAEKKALERLNAAQDAARDLASLTTGTAEDAAVNGRGTVAGAVANIFGRSSADLQLDESKAQTTILGNIERLLSEIKSEPGVPLIGDPIFTYP